MSKVIDSYSLNFAASFALAVFCIMSGSVYAAPNLQDVRALPGLIIFSDHQKKDTFYYLRNKKRLLSKNEKPDFKYDLNRYLGYKQTGNQDEFWVRGVIKFATSTDASASSYAEARDNLSSTERRAVKLMSAPVSDSYNRLVYATIEADEGEDRVEGELEGGVISGEAGAASVDNDKGMKFASDTQRYTIGLTAHDAELFWDNFENNNLSLSLSYGWTVSGMIKDINDEWVESVYQVADSLPIQVSPNEYPDLFSRNELWQRLRYTHSNLLVMCYDFINAEKTDLYYVTVDIRFPTVRKQYYRESIKFTADSDTYEQTLKFELANDIKQGYEYRVRRLTIEGERTQSDWVSSSNAFLDVSASASVLEGFAKSDIEEEL